MPTRDRTDAPRLSARRARRRHRVAAGDESRAAPIADVRPQPVEEDREAVAEADQEEDVEEVMVAIDDGDVDRRARQRAGRGEPAEAGADDDDAVPPFRAD